MKAAVKLAMLVLVVQGNTDLQAGAQNTTAAGQKPKIAQGKTQLTKAIAKKPAAKAGQKTPRSAVTTKKPEGLTHRHKWLLAGGLAGLAALAYYTSGAHTDSMKFGFRGEELYVRSGPNELVGHWMPNDMTICDGSGTRFYKWIDGKYEVNTQLIERRTCPVPEWTKKYYNPHKGKLQVTSIQKGNALIPQDWQHIGLDQRNTAWHKREAWETQCDPHGTTISELVYMGPAREVKEDKTCIEPQFSYAAILNKAHPEFKVSRTPRLKAESNLEQGFCRRP